MIAAGNQTTESQEPRNPPSAIDPRTSIDEPNTTDERAIFDAFLSLSIPLPDLANHFNISITEQIGRASCRERV